MIVSACLMGVKSRYDGSECLDEALLKELEGAALVPVCPEQLGGLSTPRASAEIHGGDGTGVLSGSARVKDENNIDVTVEFLRGAREVLNIAVRTGARRAFLKQKSPSCGVTTITADSKVRPGPGVTAALLRGEGLDVRGVD